MALCSYYGNVCTSDKLFVLVQFAILCRRGKAHLQVLMMSCHAVMIRQLLPVNYFESAVKCNHAT